MVSLGNVSFYVLPASISAPLSVSWSNEVLISDVSSMQSNIKNLPDGSCIADICEPMQRCKFVCYYYWTNTNINKPLNIHFPLKFQNPAPICWTCLVFLKGTTNSGVVEDIGGGSSTNGITITSFGYYNLQYIKNAQFHKRFMGNFKIGQILRSDRLWKWWRHKYFLKTSILIFQSKYNIKSCTLPRAAHSIPKAVSLIFRLAKHNSVSADDDVCRGVVIECGIQVLRWRVHIGRTSACNKLLHTESNWCLMLYFILHVIFSRHPSTDGSIATYTVVCAPVCADTKNILITDTK